MKNRPNRRPPNDKMVFVGGAAVSLYTDRPSSEIRPTDDVEIVVELATLREYAKIEDMLRELRNTATAFGRSSLSLWLLDGVHTVSVWPSMRIL